MYLQNKDSNWEIRAPAKLNLHLEVFSRREDGYHELETLMVPVNLFDTLWFRSQPAGRIEFACQSSGSPSTADALGFVPRDHSNLVVRAVELLRARAGIAQGAVIRLFKRIPSAAGLGGGSSDAAAALAVANRAWNLDWDIGRLRSLAAELGSDVPFFLGTSAARGGGAVCRGRGERLTGVTGLGKLHFVVARPPEGLSTAEVFASCRPASEDQAIPTTSQLQRLIRALQSGRIAAAGRLLHNRLQSSALQISGWVKRLQQEFAKLDILGYQMTGSGTSFFGICRSARHARCVAAQLRMRDVGSVYALSNCRLGLPIT